MGREAPMGLQVQDNAKPALKKRVLRDEEYVDRLEFIRACFDISFLNSQFSVIAGEPALTSEHLDAAIDETVPVIESIADRLELQADVIGRWNVEAAGRNEIILRDIERNWERLDRLGRGSG